MHAERDYLVKDVFTELREWCEARKIHLVDIDLRWGVTEADSSSNNTVLACLNNIDESRPFFLCFLGQRRGWVPKIGEVSSETLDEYPEIINVIGRNSVTEMEIEHALLSPMKHIVDGREKQEIPVNHALFYFRKPDYLDDLTNEQRKIFTNEAEPDMVSANRELEIFKERIKNNREYTVDYACDWDKNILSPELPAPINQGRLTDFTVSGKPLKDVILEQLKDEISKEFPDRENTEYDSDLERDLDQQALFIELNSEGFISREGDFDDLNDYVVNDKDGLFVLSAPAGFGKSMLLANFIKKESINHNARFINRFCGVSDLCSQQYLLWKTIFNEARVTCPDTLKELKDNIEDLLKELSNEKTVLIIDAVNQLPDGLDMLEWLPKRLPEKLKIILSIKEDEEWTDCIEMLIGTETCSFSTVKPFKKKEEKNKLILDYLKKYLKALDDQQIDAICDFEGSNNPLYLKIILSELRVFGSFAQLSNEIRQFGETPKTAFHNVLNRLENEINAINVHSKQFMPLLFGLLANARNGLSEKELVECMQKEFLIHEEKLVQAIRLFVRQVRPFMARREGRIDYFYEAFKSAAKERYINNKIQSNKILADYFKEQADPANDLSFRGKNSRDFNELPYHLKESDNTSDLEKTLSTYLWIKNKSELTDIHNTINDYSYIDVENEADYHLKLIRDTLVLSSHILKEMIKNLPTQLWGRLKDIENQRTSELLIEIDKYTDYPWLKPRHYVQTPEGSLNVTLSHASKVNSVCFSPCGKYIVSGGGDAAVVRDWKNAKEIRRLEVRNEYRFESVCFSPDGKYIAIGVEDSTIIVWDWKNKKEIQRLEGHTGSVISVCFSPNGTYIASGSCDNTVRVWDRNNAKEIIRLTGHTDWVYSVCFSYDGKYIATGSSDQTVLIWDLEKQEEVQRLEGHTNEVRSVHFSPDGKYLASGAHDRTIRVWDWKNAKEVQRLKESFVNSTCFSPNGKYIISGSSSNDEVMPVRVWDWEKKEEVHCLFGHTDRLNSVCFSPDGKYIAAGSSDMTVRVWEWENTKEMQRLKDYKKQIRFSPDGKLIPSGSNDYTTSIWDFNNMQKTQRQRGHTQSVESISISPDGKYIASGSNDTFIMVWSFDNVKEEIKRLIGHRLPVKCVCFSPDGKYIASGSLDNKIIVREWDQQKEPLRLEGHQDMVSCVSFSLDGKYIVSGSYDKTVRIWEWETQKEILRLAHKEWIYSICFSPDGNYFAVGTGESTIRIWDFENKKEIQRLEGQANPVRTICFSPDGNYIAIGSLDKTIWVWDWKNATEIQCLEDHTDAVNSICFSNDGRYIVSGSEDRTVRIREWQKNIQVISINTEEKITSCLFSNNNRQIVAGGSIGQILLYDVENLPEGYPTTEEPDNCTEEVLQKTEGHFWEVNSVCFSPNGKLLAFGTRDRKVKVWDRESTMGIISLDGHDGPVHSVCFSPDGKYIASGAWEKCVRIWDLEKQKEIQRLEAHEWNVNSVCFSPDGKYLASTSWMEKTIKIWDLEKENEVHSLTGHTDGLTCVCFSPDGKYIASGSHDKTIRVWDWEKRKTEQIQEHTDSVVSVCFSPDGKHIASGSWDRIVSVWDRARRKEIQRLEGHAWVVTCVCFSPDGKYIASGSRDRTVRIWDWQNRREVLRLEGHARDVMSVCFSPDGKRIASGSRDSSVRIWDWQKHTQTR